MNHGTIVTYWGTESLQRWPEEAMRDVALPASSKAFLTGDLRMRSAARHSRAHIVAGALSASDFASAYGSAANEGHAAV